jgi:NADH:ubiquinone oxidoreductase subunit 6 (subunit J)
VIVPVLFGFLASVAVLAAGGILLFRRPVHCSISFSVCCAALAGLYGLLSLPLVAAAQFLVGVCLTGLVIMTTTVGFRAGARMRGTHWTFIAGVPFLVLLVWAIVNGAIGEPVLTSPPIWAMSARHLTVLGQQWVDKHAVALVLVGLLLLTGIISVASLARQAREL